MQTNQQKAENAFRLVLIASQNNAISQSEMEAQVTDLICNLMHLSDEYAFDINDCLEKAEQTYKDDFLAIAS
jgi:hypothetical protein